MNYYGYQALGTDRYPPFTLADTPDYPDRLYVDEPPRRHEAVGICIAGLGLLFTGRYPRGLYNLLVGVARWSLRVTAYVALLTSTYPPFRLDRGEHEPDDRPTGPPADDA